MRALGVRSCRVTRALALVWLGYGATANAADPAPARAAPAAPAPSVAPAPAPAAPAPAGPTPAPSAAPVAPPQQQPPAPAPAPWSGPPEANPYPSVEPNPYPPPPPYYQAYPPGYYPPYGRVQVESLAPGSDAAQRAPQLPKPPRRGFQMAFRTGFSVPMGDATGAGNDSQSRRYSWQFPIAADLGWKLTDAVFVGGYVGVGFGGLGSDALSARYCEDDNYDHENEIGCSSFTFQVGAQAIYSLDPGARWNPWLGYGIGYESARQTIVHDARNYTESNTASGLTAAKLMFGTDYRSTVGIGPFVEAAVGRYLRTNTEVNDDNVHSGTISNQAFHAWLTFGIRLVVMP